MLLVTTTTTFHSLLKQVFVHPLYFLTSDLLHPAVSRVGLFFFKGNSVLIRVNIFVVWCVCNSTPTPLVEFVERN